VQRLAYRRDMWGPLLNDYPAYADRQLAVAHGDSCCLGFQFHGLQLQVTFTMLLCQLGLLPRHALLLLCSKPVDTFRRTWGGDWAPKRCC
jgi:hypothetical protein